MPLLYTLNITNLLTIWQNSEYYFKCSVKDGYFVYASDFKNFSASKIPLIFSVKMFIERYLIAISKYKGNEIILAQMREITQLKC